MLKENLTHSGISPTSANPDNKSSRIFNDKFKANFLHKDSFLLYSLKNQITKYKEQTPR